MRFSTIFIVFAASATAFAGAIIETPAKRSLVDVNAACTVVLNNTLQTTLPEIVNCFDDTCTSTLIDELTDAIDGCDTALTTLPDGSQSASDSVANTFASVITVSLGEFLRSDALYSCILSEHRDRSQRARDHLQQLH